VSFGKGPVVFVLHGWGSSAPAMRHLADAIVKSGRRAVLADLPGCGMSSGRRCDLGRASLALRDVLMYVHAHTPVAHVVAHSFGGPVVLSAISRIQADPAYTAAHGGATKFNPLSICTINSPAQLDAYLQPLVKTLALPARVFEGVRARMVSVSDEGAGARFPDELPELLADPPFALLLLHDGADRVVSSQSSVALHLQ
jgi:pimeloyl-ACP methyl ester carboxylesterase